MTWTDERVDDLMRLWDEGHSASYIGKMLGVTKNAVVGKAHRLKLPARPSPIRRMATPRRPKPAAAPRRMAQPRPAPVIRPTLTVTGNASCLWPIGDPGDADFHFCGDNAVVSKPYCPEHCARAYLVKSRPNSEAA